MMSNTRYPYINVTKAHYLDCEVNSGRGDNDGVGLHYKLIPRRQKSKGERALQQAIKGEGEPV